MQTGSVHRKRSVQVNNTGVIGAARCRREEIGMSSASVATVSTVNPLLPHVTSTGRHDITLARARFIAKSTVLCHTSGDKGREDCGVHLSLYLYHETNG